MGLLVWIALLAASGCGPSFGSVSGKVLSNGKPLKGGNVTFVSGEGIASVAVPIAEDGSYRIDKIQVGEVKVCVETQSLNPARMARAPSYQPPPGMTAPGGYMPTDRTALARRFVAIPEKYAETQTTPLKYTVQSGSQQYDITLE